jgi:5-methylcytosine-specific restriction protein A
VARQAQDGYVLDYITRTIERPNAGFESDPEYLRNLEEHAPVAGRLIAVHRLRPGSGRSQREIIGAAAFERLQDMWARDGNRCRWSVAFPIIESYDIENPPDASDVFGPASYRRLFAHPATLLRPFTYEDRTKLADLKLIPRQAPNAWIAIEDEAAIAARDMQVIPRRIRQDIERDLSASVMEGLSEERRRMARTRAAWNAYKFVLARQKAGRLTCDDCNFDPINRIAGTGVKPRSLLDVHHREPFAEGIQYTRPTDSYFKLLCPTCHRLEHAVMRLKPISDIVGPAPSVDHAQVA